MKDLVPFTFMCGPGCRCSETSVLHPVKEFSASPRRKDALVLDRYCATSISCPIVVPSQEKFIRVPDFIRTVSLRLRHNLRNCQAPTCAHESGAVRSCVMVCACICQDAALAGQQCAFLRIARIRRAPGYFAYTACCHLRYALHSTAWSLLPSIRRDRQYEPWTARL